MRTLPATFAVSLALALPAAAQEGPKGEASPGELVAAAPANDWVEIAPADLLVMTLAPDRDGAKRQVTIQLMPPPFSQGWVGNIRKLAAAHWWDGLAITRVQDNYVVQWGDPDAEEKAQAKALPAALATPHEGQYEIEVGKGIESALQRKMQSEEAQLRSAFEQRSEAKVRAIARAIPRDAYSDETLNFEGWPIAVDRQKRTAWPVHCYGMVGVGRNYSPDTGSGAELYTVIGHAPRHLDRNIALAGRAVEGIEHLSSLPRGTGALGF